MRRRGAKCASDARHTTMERSEAARACAFEECADVFTAAATCLSRETRRVAIKCGTISRWSSSIASRERAAVCEQSSCAFADAASSVCTSVGVVCDVHFGHARLMHVARVL